MTTRLTVIEGDYLRDIRQQPEALQATWSGLEFSPPWPELARRLARGDFDRLVLTGMGSSFHALQPLTLRLVQHGWPVWLVETSELVFCLPRLMTPRTLLVVVSQSGASAETVRLLNSLPAAVTLVGVTNTPGSPLAQRASVGLTTRAGDESCVTTKTYLTAVMALEWLGTVLIGGDLERTRQELAASIPAVAEYLAGLQLHVDFLGAELAGVETLFVTGRGASLAAVGAGALILKEAAYFPAEGMSSAAFRHGPLEMVTPETLVLVLEGAESVAPLNRRLVGDIVRLRGRAALIGPGAESPVFRLPSLAPGCQPLVELLPLEMVSVALAARVGHEAGKFAHTAKITTIE